MSRLESGFTTELGAVTVIVDSKAIIGMQLGSLADYFAVLTMAEARLGRRCKEFETIANLMMKDCEPGLAAKEITRNDILLLTALYQVPDESMGRLQSLRVASRLRRALEAEAGK
jgi:hypothetical protein